MMRILHSVPVAAAGYLVALAAVLAQSQTPSPAQPQSPPPLVLSGGTVVDVGNWGDSANDIKDAVVVIEGSRIAAVGPAAAVQIPLNAQIIDCTGKYIIPGLVDGFAGMNSQGQANANLYMGVTTVVVRQDQRHGLIDFAANPKPHLYPVDSVGTTDNWSLLAGQPGWNSLLKENARQAELSPETTGRQLIATQKLGTRVVFLGHDITAANAQWIITRAHQLGLVTYGEFIATPYTVGIEAGVDALVHMGRYELGVIPSELQEPLVTDPDGPGSRTAYDYSERLPPTDPHWRTYAQFIASHHAALLPTFSVYYAQLPAHSNLWQEPAAPLLNAASMYHPTDSATGELDYDLPNWARHLPAILQRSMQNELRKRADQAALRLWMINQTIFGGFPHYLAGSGANSMGAMSGISEHTELELLVRLGLSPREALAAATNNYSLQFGWHDLGQIAPGRRADILVLDADPSANIWNARRISTLIFDGNIMDREGLLHLKK
ncbi:MAG TPA: amidohydrolase family protein [Terracidiphilus sp.]|nr:amidohydrolase family protein [Terracidiphilus sp.]